MEFRHIIDIIEISEFYTEHSNRLVILKKDIKIFISIFLDFNI